MDYNSFLLFGGSILFTYLFVHAGGEAQKGKNDTTESKNDSGAAILKVLYLITAIGLFALAIGNASYITSVFTYQKVNVTTGLTDTYMSYNYAPDAAIQYYGLPIILLLVLIVGIILLRFIKVFWRSLFH
jgi:hypothetical protein